MIARLTVPQRAAKIALLLIFLTQAASQLCAQASLTIVDAIPPYKLNPTVLSNGHFSISTNYTTPTKGIIYREDGSNNKPVNYTSFFHVKIDSLVYEQQYESDTSGFGNPVQHPILVDNIFRDTLSNVPRINCLSHAILPNNDTMRFVFTMFPVKKPSGGFIRINVFVDNSTSAKHSVGVLLLIDTKIGNNDQAPIATSYGYSIIEQEFNRGVGQGVPSFWLALEGTPIAPGLVARGNLRDDGVIEPDRLLFGNWTDYTSQGIRGLGSVVWKERSASTNAYTDSAVLLLWDEEQFAAGLSKIKASTEIGIVDSLSVGFAGGGGGGGGGSFGGGGFGLAGVGTCLSVDTLLERPCGLPGYSPYLPDTLQALYLLSNLDSVKSASNVSIRIEQLPLGLVAPSTSTAVIPSSLGPDQTGVCALSLVPLPRLVATSYQVPIAVTADPGSTVVLRDTLDVCVPGVAVSIHGLDQTYPPVCPQMVDTFDVRYTLKGPRCVETLSATLSGAPADVALFSIVQPLPTWAPADSIVTIRVRYAPVSNLYTPTVGVVLSLKDFETLTPGDTTFAFPSDTAFITCPSRIAEFEFGRSTDTLNFGHICVGDTARADWDVLNIGGCSLTLLNCSYKTVLNSTAFSTDPSSTFPDVVDRSDKKTVNFLFTPKTSGSFVSLAIINSASAPGLDTLVLVGQADTPSLQSIAALTDLDTVCVGSDGIAQLKINNPTACPVVIDSIRISSSQTGWTVSPAGPVTVNPNGTMSATLRGSFAATGNYSAQVTVFSGTQQFQTNASLTVITREMTSVDTLDFGDVFVNATKLDSIVLHSTGTADLVLNANTLAGLFPSEYTVSVSGGAPLPLTIPVGDSVTLLIQFKPKDIEQRPATLQTRLNTGLSCAAVQAIYLKGRGVQPLLDVRSHTLALGRLCFGSSTDTVISVRNPGNYPLHIASVQANGSSAFHISDVSGSVVQPDSSLLIPVSYTPDQLGTVSTQLHFTSDGLWISPTDTLITLNAVGIICGTIAADTVDAKIGYDLNMPVRFIPDSASSMSAQQMVGIMNASSNQAMGIRLGYSDSLARFYRLVNNSDMASTTGLLSVQQNTAEIQATNQNLNTSAVIATLQGDVLLSPTTSTVVRVEVDSFANGFSRIRTRNGLIRSQYCAFDDRLVNTSGVHTIFQLHAHGDNATAEMYSNEDADATIRVFTLNGEVLQQYSVHLSVGTQYLTIGQNLSSGFYLVTLCTATEQHSDRMLLWR